MRKYVKRRPIKSSILTEYDDIREQIGDAKYQAVMRFLDDHPEYDLSDVYYKESVWKQMEREQGIKASRKVSRHRSIKAASGDFIYVIEDNGEPVAKGTYDAMMKKMYTYTHPVTVRKYPKAKLNSLIKMGKDAHVSNPLKFAVNRYINDNRDEYSSLNSSVRASRNGRKIMASTGKKIPYDLVSMAAILRDYADLSRDAYASDEHMLLTDIADTLYNVGRSAAKTFKNEYADLYKQYGEAYFDQVLSDISALDSQVSSNNIEELIEDYEDRLDSGIGAATKIRASRASRVMAAKRSIHFTVTVTDTDEIIDVLEDQDEAIEVARKYTQKYGDSATVEKEWIGSDGEVYDSTVCFQTDSDFSSSTKIAKRPIKASRPIMAGAGAGITLELEDLTFTEVPNSGFYNEYNEYHDFLEPENGACKGTIEIKSIGTYYDGGNPNAGVIPVSIFVEEVIPYDAEDAQQMMQGTLKDVIDEFDEFEPTIRIGGGWTRVTFDGTFEVEGYSGYSKLKLKVEIEDKDMVRWLDLFANGEADDLYYDICINGNPEGDAYYSQEDAIATAKEYASDPEYADDEITVEMRHYATDYMGDIMYDYDDDGDVVWSSEDDLYE